MCAGMCDTGINGPTRDLHRIAGPPADLQRPPVLHTSPQVGAGATVGHDPGGPGADGNAPGAPTAASANGAVFEAGGQKAPREAVPGAGGARAADTSEAADLTTGQQAELGAIVREALASEVRPLCSFRVALLLLHRHHSRSHELSIVRCTTL